MTINYSNAILQRTVPWLVTAVSLIGQREIPGPRHNSAVVRMWEAIKAPFRDDETPWCAAFVGYCLEVNRVPSTKSAAARSYINWGSDCLAPLQAAYGAVVVLSRPGSAWSGHVGFLTGYDPDEEVLQILGGNQDNRVKHSEYPLKRLVSVRWPPGVPVINMLRCPEFRARGNTSRSDA